MSQIENIQRKIINQCYELSKHAVDQSIVRGIEISELEQAFCNNSEVIEDYPDDKYGPSCLVLGFTDAGRPLHVQCSYPERELIKIITLYEPDPKRWNDFRTRKRRY